MSTHLVPFLSNSKQVKSTRCVHSEKYTKLCVPFKKKKHECDAEHLFLRRYTPKQKHAELNLWKKSFV